MICMIFAFAARVFAVTPKFWDEIVTATVEIADFVPFAKWYHNFVFGSIILNSGRTFMNATRLSA